ncbi:protein kinase [Pelomyxa schiedti]|nr:protein kinase [Pelomyxa schiedti]
MGVPGTTSMRRGPYIYYRGRGCVAVMGCALLLLLATICCFRGAAVATHQRHQNHIQQQPTKLLKPSINSGGIGISTGRRTGVVGVTVGVGSSSVAAVAATTTIGGQYGVNRPSAGDGDIDGFLDGGTAVSTVEWSGGVTCDKCASFNYTSHYACSSDSNNWANGVKSFVDPTPFGSVITEITFALMGVYSCTSLTTPASILLYLGRKQVDTESTTFPVTTCRCPNCAMEVVLTETGLQGWPTYNTSGINTIQVVVLTNSICLSYISILFTYDFTPSTVSSLFPNCGPTSGGTQVLVYGNNFFESSQINCHFGNQISNGTYISDTTIECTAPPSPEKGVFNFTVSYKADASVAISQAVYTFYEQVALLKVDPSSGLIAGGTTLRLSGNNIYDTGSLLSCMFTGHDGTVDFAEGKYETGDVLCTTPEWTQKETVNLSLSLNSQQFCTPILFSFKDENFLEQHTIGVLVLLVCIILFSGTMIATVALCRRRKKQRLPQVLLSTETLDMQDIQLEGRIGSGTFGEVYKAKWRGVTIAIKRLPPAYSGNEFQQKFRKEVDIMRSLRHPNVLQFFGCCMDPPDMCFAMEYMPKGSFMGKESNSGGHTTKKATDAGVVKDVQHSVAATSTIGGQYGVNRPSGDGGGIDGFLDGGTATSTVEWSGGITCDKCASWNYTSHYACSSDSNSWANGVKSFVDPTPFGSVITEITFFLMGVYSCTSFTTPASILLYLGRKQVDTDSTTFPLSTCRCPNCAMQVVVLTNSICLSYITILFTYDFTPSTVSSLFPNCGPISGGTQVLVYGNNFFESSQINCHFGNQIGNGTYISDTTIECTAPPSPEKGVFNFTVSYKADASLAISQAVYTFYDQVVLLKVDPSSGLIAGGTTLRLSGNNIYDTGSLLSCMFTGHDGTVEFAEGKYETGDVLCTTPEWTQKETVNLSLALNSQQFCTPILFSFKDENFLEQHTIGVLVLLVCIILFSGTMIATVALCRRRKKQRLPQVLLSTETLDMQDIQLEGRIGSGTFGEVYKAKWRGVTIAIKRLPPAYSGNEFQQKFRKEVDIMRSLRHPNVQLVLDLA